MMYGFRRERLLEPVRFDAAGIDRIHLNAIPNSNICYCLREREAGAVHRTADCEFRAGSASSCANDVQHGTASRLKVRPCRARQAHRSKKLQSESVRPVRIRQFKKIPALCRPGIIHDDVDSAVSLEGGVHYSGRSAGIAEVLRDDSRSAAGGFDL